VYLSTGLISLVYAHSGLWIFMGAFFIVAHANPD
jgi:hypothetical protein